MRYLWVHGFASGPLSSKGRFARDRLRDRGVELAIPDFNEPSFFHLTVSRMLAQIDDLAGAREPVTLFGSSLGGFAAATWAATRPDRATALVLLAPAFDLAPRWAARMGPEELMEHKAKRPRVPLQRVPDGDGLPEDRVERPEGHAQHDVERDQEEDRQPHDPGKGERGPEPAWVPNPLATDGPRGPQAHLPVRL